MLQLTAKARKRDLSMSTTVRRLLRKVLTEDDGEVDAALDAEMMGERMESGLRALASRLSFLLVWLIYDVGYIKLLSSSTLGMQKDMTPDLLKDIFQQADRKTTAALERKRPELTPLVEAVEKWLLTAEEDAQPSGEGTNGANGKPGRGGSTV